MKYPDAESYRNTSLSKLLKDRDRIPYPIADLYDKCSIESLKNIRASSDNWAFLDTLRRALITEPNYDPDLYVQLQEINGRIWDLESDIRKGKEGELGLEEVGRRAIAIRNINGERIALKQKIAELHAEKKYNHASE